MSMSMSMSTSPNARSRYSPGYLDRGSRRWRSTRSRRNPDGCSTRPMRRSSSRCYPAPADLVAYRVVALLRDTAVLPRAEEIVEPGPGRESRRQRPPHAAVVRHLQDCVDDFPAAGASSDGGPSSARAEAARPRPAPHPNPTAPKSRRSRPGSRRPPTPQAVTKATRRLYQTRSRTGSTRAHHRSITDARPSGRCIGRSAQCARRPVDVRGTVGYSIYRVPIPIPIPEQEGGRRERHPRRARASP